MEKLAKNGEKGQNSQPLSPGAVKHLLTETHQALEKTFTVVFKILMKLRERVPTTEPFHPAARYLSRRAPVVHRGSGDGTPGVGATEPGLPETQLIGTAVRRLPLDDGAVTYGAVVQYNSKANRFLVTL